MKDMYLDYSSRKRVSKGRKLAYFFIVLLLAGALGTGGYFAASYYIEKMDEQNNGGSTGDAGIAGTQVQTVPADDAGDEIVDEQGTGPYGMWYAEAPAENTSEEPVYEEELWMSDFVDNRVRVEAKGIYVSSAYINKYLDKAVDLIDRTELNAMVIDIKSDSGYITYQMDYDMAKEIGACTSTIGDIGATVKRLKEHGIYLIARVVALKDPILAEKRPELALHNKDGSLFRDRSGLAWVNPYKQEVWDYLLGVAEQCVAIGFDEVNFDYIRFATDSGMKDVDFGEGTEDITRIDVITAGIKNLCEKLKPMGVFVSCDVYGAIISSAVDARIVGQSYFNMSSYLDYICPMVYPSHYGDGYYNLDHPDLHPYDLVFNALMDSRKVLSMIDEDGNKAIVRPWLQDFTASWLRYYKEYTAVEVRDQINAVYETGYGEWLLWNAGINYSEDALETK